ncbi:uncharacterized protein BXZ73DRAFT_103679 [Epithele typhae]|uniref:uncharacterized protein n=1 Tax=Epithele typhae TaxID=378194 RepID=UPI002008E4C8|nr:uncharacterized protein BXZ73DRAFT_103679 [Epithele typhae]KAH9923945.1 hypothetical protein BXZ73DRAFT_103679 [Epithele typhae]
MSAAKKTSTSKSATARKGAPRAAPSHPPWIDMIKECILEHPEDARQGVSRPMIKKFVEDKYKLEIGAAQNTQLSKALQTGASKSIFVLPKGFAGRVKLPPKSVRPAGDSATKENKPDSKAAAKPKAAAKKPVAKTATAKTTTKKTAVAKKSTATKASAGIKKPVPKAATKAAVAKPKAAAAKPKAAPAKKASTTAPKKAPAKKAAPAPKKTAAASKRDSAKKSVTGKAPAKKPAAKATGTKTSSRTKAAKK